MELRVEEAGTGPSLKRTKSWLSLFYHPTTTEKEDREIDLELLYDMDVSDRDQATVLALTNHLALMFEQPEEWRLKIAGDLTEMVESGKSVTELLHFKRKLMKSMDSFEEDDKWRQKQRFVTKKGIVHVSYKNMPGLKKKIALDFFHTIMDAKWRYFILLFFTSFLVTWLIFAGIWYGIYVARKDTMCIDNVDSFTTALLFSIETQITIGYGGRAVTDKCPEGIIVMIIQTVIGTFVNTALLGVLFAKLARPRNRGKTIVFCKQAVITLRDEQYCLIFRYVDLRERKLLDSNMRLVIVKPHLTEEGEYIPLNMLDMSLTVDYGQVEYTMRLFPIYPISIIHIIDEDSPLYNLSKHDLETTNFEIIAILEGTVPGTGNCTEAITSFKPSEIKWGHRFQPIFVGIKPGSKRNCIDLTNLNKMYAEEVTPECSAREYDGESSDSGSSSSGSNSSSSSEKPPSFYTTNFKTQYLSAKETSKSDNEKEINGKDLRSEMEIIDEEKKSID